MSLLAITARAEPVVLIVGDSLSAAYGIRGDQGWPHLLDQRLEAEGYAHRVVNASISGDTTANGLRRLPALLAKHLPAVVVVALGSNDGLRGLAPPTIADNFQQIRLLFGAMDAILIVPRVRIPPNYGPAYLDRFDAVFDSLGDLEDVVLAPFMLREFAARVSLFQSDGLHPTAEAQPLILETLWPTIQQALGPP